MVVQESGQNKQDFRVVGIDQALQNIGFCCNLNGKLDGMLVRELRLKGPARMDSLENQVRQLVGVFQPELIAMEGYSFNSLNRAFDLGGIGEILKLCFFRLHIPTIIVSPSQLKQFVSGNGDASKATVMRAVHSRYGYETNNDNIADAVGLAKFAEVYITGYSTFRSELDTVLKFKEKEGTIKVKRRYVSVRSI